MNGQIVKALSGFYYVKADDNSVYTCKAKGAFRNENITPFVGDYVAFDITGELAKEGNITEIKPRKNELARPSVANVDQAVVVFAVRDPYPNFSILDRFLVLMKKQGIETIIVFNKKDLAKSDDIKNIKTIYKKAGCKLYFINARDGGFSMWPLKWKLKNKLTVMAGPSGVGKSTLLNKLENNEDVAETGAISSKIGRGKNTTRHNEIYTIKKKYRVIDTPGFTSLLVSDTDYSKEELYKAFPEFEPYIGKCKFSNCSHVKERDCAISEAVSKGEIAQNRYNSYKSIYAELKSQQKY